MVAGHAAARVGSEERWEEVACPCGAEASVPVLTVPHPDAPDGRSPLVACRACGLRRLSPRPPRHALGRYYDDDHNAFVGRQRGRVTQVVWDALRDVAAGRWPMLRPFAPLAAWCFDVAVPVDAAAPPRVLEVGSGYGDLLCHLRARGCTVLGVDLDPRAVARARTLGLDVREGTLASQGLPDASVDVAVACHSLEHVPDPLAELRELARVLRPGGRLHLAVPNGDSAAFRADGAAWEHLAHPVHLWLFDAPALTALLARAGFDVAWGPRTVTGLRHLTRWRRELGPCGPGAATRGLATRLAAELAATGRGDVLRVIAVRP